MSRPTDGTHGSVSFYRREISESFHNMSRDNCPGHTPGTAERQVNLKSNQTHVRTAEPHENAEPTRTTTRFAGGVRTDY